MFKITSNCRMKRDKRGWSKVRPSKSIFWLSLCLRSLFILAYLVSWSSGKQNSRTSLVGIVLIFSLLRAGMLSSRTVPLSGRRSEVLTIKRYIQCSDWLLRWWGVWLPPMEVWPKEDEEELPDSIGTLSLRMVTATGPRFSSIPNQFWCSELRNKVIHEILCKYNNF